MSQFVANGLVASAVYLIVGIAFYFTFVFCQRFDVSVAAFVAIGPYMTYAFQPYVGFWIAVALALFIGMLLGCVLQRAVYAAMVRRSPSGLTGMVASFGIYIIIQNLLACVFGDVRTSLRTWPVQEGHRMLGAYLTTPQILTIGCSVACLLAVWAGLHLTSFGRQVRAIPEDAELARCFGVHVERVRVWATGIGAAIASGAGILIASDVDMTPVMGMQPFLMGVIAGIIGRRSFFGIAAGALVVGLSQHIAVVWLPTAWQNGIAFAILLLCLAARRSYRLEVERSYYR